MHKGYFKEGERMKDTKETIFHNARTAFSEFGYKRTSLDQIAKMSGAGKSTIYHYVTSKRALFEEIISEEIEHAQQAVSIFLDGSPSLDHVIEFLFNCRDSQLNSELISKIINESKQIGTTEAFEELARLEENNHKMMSQILSHFAIDKDEEELKILSFLLVEVFNLLTIKWEETNPALEKNKVKRIFNQVMDSQILSD